MIRAAELDYDIAINDIGNWYIEKTAINFEVKAWSRDQRRKWIESFNTQNSRHHLLVTTIAFQLLQLTRHCLKAGGFNYSWDRIHKIMYSVQHITVVYECRDGRMLHVRKATVPKMEQPRICELFGVDTPFFRLDGELSVQAQ